MNVNQHFLEPLSVPFDEKKPVSLTLTAGKTVHSSHQSNEHNMKEAVEEESRSPYNGVSSRAAIYSSDGRMKPHEALRFLSICWHTLKH